MLPLYKGDVNVDGIELNYIPLDGTAGARAIFDRMSGALEFDVSEMSITEFISRLVRGASPLVAIPVFTSRNFRHSMMVINRKSGIRSPKDLDGKRIGLPIYAMTAAVVARGLLKHEYGVDLSSIHWIQGALNKPGRHGTPTEVPLLTAVKLEDNKSGKSLGQMLVDGEIDAIIGSTIPDVFRTNPDIVRLFPNYREVEKDYYRRTRIFPIMHLIAIRRDVYEKHPFVASSLYNAMIESKKRQIELMRDTGELAYMVPWLYDDIDEIDELFGGDAFPYGIEANRPSLEALMLWLHEQGIIAKRLPIEDLFVPTFEKL
ncbi:MAG: ABC transporter substrate-binding protein [Hyphomicrobiales bacterium]|nr:ABC transporter substrate-binding protein [Hyphomicrobiales bacterium]